LLLANWVAGFSGMVGFGILFFGRISREQRMMLGHFRRQLSRIHQSDRPHFPAHLLNHRFLHTDRRSSQSPGLVLFLQHFVKKKAPKGRFWILVIEPVTSIS